MRTVADERSSRAVEGHAEQAAPSGIRTLWPKAVATDKPAGGDTGRSAPARTSASGGAVGRAFAYSIAAAIIVLGAIKIYSVLRESNIDLRLGLSAGWIWLLGMAEVLVGVALFGLRRRGVAGTALADLLQNFVLTVFCVASLLRAIGVTSARCACFGGYELPAVPVAAITSVLLVLSAILNRPRLHALRGEIMAAAVPPPTVRGGLVGLLLFAVTVAAVLSRPIRQTVAVGLNLVQVVAPPVEVTHLRPGEVGEAALTLRNLSDHAIEIVGATNSCSCFALDRPRFLLPPSGEASVRVNVLPEKGGFFHQRVVFFLSGCRQRTVDVDFFGYLTTLEEAE